MPRTSRPAPVSVDETRRALDVAVLDVEIGVYSDASDEGLTFLTARARAAARRYDAVLSQTEHDRPFQARCDRLTQRRRAQAIYALTDDAAPGAIAAAVAIDQTTEVTT